MTFPIVDREPVRTPTLAGHDDELWDTLIELSEMRPGEWTLIGGQMVFLHAIEHGATPPRISTDLDVLAPEGLGDRIDLTTTPPGRTIQVPGGTRALDRTALLPVATSTRSGHVPRPSLLGATVGKAMAVGVDDVPNAQRLDFVFLLSLVDDPFVVAEQLTTKDRRRIRARKELIDGEHRVWNELEPASRDRARAALRIISR